MILGLFRYCLQGGLLGMMDVSGQQSLTDMLKFLSDFR